MAYQTTPRAKRAFSTQPGRSLLRALGGALLFAATALFAPLQAKPDTQTATPRAVDLVIALDVSGSMSGLIASAKQHLWSVVNEMGQAQPQPDLRVAILSYGSPRYGQASGYVHIAQPFTRDLDAVNAALFSFTTSGGAEYVARVITTAVDQLQWTEGENAVRMMFVAGNESAAQDPKVQISAAMAKANRADIVVNTIYCAQSRGPGASKSWREVAQLGQGMFASIDQNKDAVAQSPAPQDQRLQVLNQKLNATYIPFGDAGEKRKEAQARQDTQSGVLGLFSLASRTVTKAGSLYRSGEWDLVDAIESGTKLDDLEAEALPKAMRAMSTAEKQRYVEEKAEERAAVKQEIAQLAEERAAYLKAEREAAPRETLGLDEAMKAAVRATVTKKGFTFTD
ncbi:MAG: VWA domain-containing protein [Gammaproteobacteria bacterium]|nr:VWA domain-containing protein [Gammaproteobacteria bacterium]